MLDVQKVHIMDKARLEPGRNLLTNRSTVLNDKVEYDWLNLTIDSFKVKCKKYPYHETDAKISTKIEIVATFPDPSHVPIVYPIALVTNANMANTNKLASDYLNYLQSPSATAIFKKYGFSIQH